MPTKTSTRFRIILLAAVVSVIVGGSVAAVSLPVPSSGTIPDEAWLSDGTVDHELIPDFVTALDRDGNEVGFVAKESLFPADGSEPIEGANPVFGPDLREIVGHMVDGRGFVAIGTPVDEIPPFPTVTYGGD